MGFKMNRLELRHIVCPIDLSGEYRSSLLHSITMARARAAELRALHVVPSEGPAPPEELDSLRHDELMQRLRDLLADADPDHTLVGAAVR